MSDALSIANCSLLHVSGPRFMISVWEDLYRKLSFRFYGPLGVVKQTPQPAMAV